MLKSFQRNKKGILLMLISSLCVCIGQLLWKLSSNGSVLFWILRRWCIDYDYCI